VAHGIPQTERGAMEEDVVASLGRDCSEREQENYSRKDLAKVAGKILQARGGATLRIRRNRDCGAQLNYP
jgi:hypothetical protein